MLFEFPGFPPPRRRRGKDDDLMAGIFILPVNAPQNMIAYGSNTS